MRPMRNTVALGRSHGLLALLAGICSILTSTADPGQHIPSYGKQGEAKTEFTHAEYPDPGSWTTSSTPAGVRPSQRDELRSAGRGRRVVRLGPERSDYAPLKKGEQKRLVSQVRRAQRALDLEYATLQAELVRAADARRKVVYDADLLQMVTCDDSRNIQAAGLRSPAQEWDIASHRGRKAWTSALTYYKPLVVAVRLADKPSHTNPEVLKSVLHTITHQQQRGRY